MPASEQKSSRLLIFFGMVAAGKSFLARRWAERHGCAYYNTDVVRKQLAGMMPGTRQPAGIGQGIYNPELTRRTYDELLQLARQERDRLAGCVVLDGSYRDQGERDRIVAGIGGCKIYFIYCRCSESCIRQRLALRAEDPAAVSDGTWEIYQMQRRQFQVPEQITGAQLLMLDTERPLPELLEAVDNFVFGGQQPPAS